MAIGLGWFAVRSDEDLTEALKKVRSRAAYQDVPERFRIARNVDMRRQSSFKTLRGPLGKSGIPFVVTSAVIEGPYHSAGQWAQAASQELKSAAVSFFVFEGAWNYSIFDAGEEIAAFETYSLPRPALYGDIDRAAAIFQVDPGIFRRYAMTFERNFDAIKKDGQAAEPKAFRGDRFPPTDEWAHIDFARRLGGIVYPNPGEGTEFSFAADADASQNETWIGLPERLPIPGFPPSAGPNEIDFDNFPSGDDPF